MPELLRTKLFIPRPRPGLVLRPRLTGRLNAGLDHRLTLIAAPAGFGKTTLLGEWIPQCPRCVTWLSLDAGDNDPTRFWAYIIAALQQVHPRLGAGALASLQSPQPPPLTTLITSLINDVAAFPDPIAAVLEDYHIIDSQAVHASLAYLIDHLPHNLHLTITTRVDPPLPVARLRVRDQLTELRAADLRFTVDEAAAFLNSATGLDLSAREVAALESRTEGWIAGLQIAALSMQGRGDSARFVEAFSGSHRHIVGYLAEEVLNQRPRGTLSFLLQTSILDRLCASLCNAVTGDEDGQAILEKLEQTNLFIAPLDDEQVWYRYHQLFAEVLQARLQRTWPEQAPELHRRAARWHAAHGMPDEAVRHALAGGDFDEAAGLIEEVAGDMLRRGAGASLTRWLDAVPAEMIRARPRLCLARAWTFLWGSTLDLDLAEAWAQRALQSVKTDRPPQPDLLGEIAALRAIIASTRSKPAISRDMARQALENLPPDSAWRSAVTFCLGTAHVDGGDVAVAQRAFEEAIQLSQAEGAHYVQMAAAAFLGDILVLQGHLSRAQETYGQVLGWANPDLPQKGGVMAHAGLASILCERNQFAAALAHVRTGFAMVDQVGGAWSAFVINRVVARIQRANGDWSAALDTLERSWQSGQRSAVGLITVQSAALRTGVQLGLGNLDAALDWAAGCGLSPEDDVAHTGWREMEYLALARVLDAQGRQSEASLLLDRLLQAARTEKRNGSAIAILILRAVLDRAPADRSRALADLQRALDLAEPEGYVRIFVDEGEPMRALLVDYLARRQSGDGDQRLYAARLLEAFAPAAAGLPVAGDMVEPLSEREREILQLIAAGLSNQEIADQLVIAHSTVKSHINTIYGKLGTHRRTQAVVVARELGLLP